MIGHLSRLDWLVFWTIAVVTVLSALWLLVLVFSDPRRAQTRRDAARRMGVTEMPRRQRRDRTRWARW